MWSTGHDQKGGLSGAGVQKPTTFLASSCNEITVSGAGYEKTNGIYTRSTAGLPNGGDATYGYFCKGGGTDCTAGVFNMYDSAGWGIQNTLHHRYYNGDAKSKWIRPFTTVRTGGGSSVDGVAPIPTFSCTKTIHPHDEKDGIWWWYGKTKTSCKLCEAGKCSAEGSSTCSPCSKLPDGDGKNVEEDRVGDTLGRIVDDWIAGSTFSYTYHSTKKSWQDSEAACGRLDE